LGTEMLPTMHSRLAATTGEDHGATPLVTDELGDLVRSVEQLWSNEPVADDVTVRTALLERLSAIETRVDRLALHREVGQSVDADELADCSAAIRRLERRWRAAMPTLDPIDGERAA
jgi:hypothetical protein